jgi:hypothetical protein
VRTLRVLPEAEEELAQAAEWYEAKRALKTTRLPATKLADG